MLIVSPNKRFVMDHDGKPFCSLADTAWALLQRLGLVDADDSLRDRRSIRFIAIYHRTK